MYSTTVIVKESQSGQVILHFYQKRLYTFWLLNTLYVGCFGLIELTLLLLMITSHQFSNRLLFFWPKRNVS